MIKIILTILIILIVIFICLHSYSKNKNKQLKCYKDKSYTEKDFKDGLNIIFNGLEQHLNDRFKTDNIKFNNIKYIDNKYNINTSDINIIYFTKAVKAIEDPLNYVKYNINMYTKKLGDIQKISQLGNLRRQIEFYKTIEFNPTNNYEYNFIKPIIDLYNIKTLVNEDNIFSTYDWNENENKNKNYVIKCSINYNNIRFNLPFYDDTKFYNQFMDKILTSQSFIDIFYNIYDPIYNYVAEKRKIISEKFSKDKNLVASINIYPILYNLKFIIFNLNTLKTYDIIKIEEYNDFIKLILTIEVLKNNKEKIEKYLNKLLNHRIIDNNMYNDYFKFINSTEISNEFNYDIYERYFIYINRLYLICKLINNETRFSNSDIDFCVINIKNMNENWYLDSISIGKYNQIIPISIYV